VTATEEYIQKLTELKSGDLGLLRTHGGRPLDESVDGFDLFAGLWWPLRRDNPTAPRRSVAWLIAKVFAACPMRHSAGDTLARQLGQCSRNNAQRRQRLQDKFDEMLALPLDELEPCLNWALRLIAAGAEKIDWVQLTNDLSDWENESKRLEWAKQYIERMEVSC